MTSKSNLAGRRKFLQQLGASAILLSGANGSTEPVGESADGAAEEENGGEQWAILIDTTRCTGCQRCAVACQAEYAMPISGEPPGGLSSDALTFVDSLPFETAVGEPGIRFVKRQCMHCLHPACASACTVGALRKTGVGPVVYDADKCIGCRYCQYACPFGVPTYSWDEPLGLISKCQMCVERLSAGQKPACTEACPNGALRLGKRQELLAQAHAQIASNPGRYVDHVYGEHEAGGTAVLYLSAVPFMQLGFPVLGSEIVPGQAEVIMQNTPVVALTVAALATSLYWLTRRRAKLAEETVLPVTVPAPESSDASSSVSIRESSGS